MKAPNFPSFSDNWPALQEGQRRGSEPSPFAGKTCGPSSSLRLSSTSLVRRSLVPVDGAGKIPPEIAQHRLPVDLIVGNKIELFFEIGGEIELPT